MPGAYHSALNGVEGEQLCGCTVLPIRRERKPKKPSAGQAEGEQAAEAAAAGGGDDGGEVAKDIVDETIYYFRANVLFKSFQFEGGADKVLAYLTLFMQMCLKAVAKCPSKDAAGPILEQLGAASGFAVPGGAGFPLNGFIAAPSGDREASAWRDYMKKLRKVLASRVADAAFDEAGAPNRFYLQFANFKFMNKELKA